MLDLELENEVFNDFKTCLDQLDFKHIRPTSPEMIAAINVGTMWRLIHKMNKREMEAMAMNGEMKNTEHYSEEEHQKMAVDMTVEMQEINDKLKEVENQYDRYVITEKDHYHKFAMEGLAQAEMMIKDAGSKMSEAEYKDKMKCYEDWYISLHHKLNDVNSNRWEKHYYYVSSNSHTYFYRWKRSYYSYYFTCKGKYGLF